MLDTMSHDDVLRLLRAKCIEAGSIAAFARKSGCNRTQVHAVMSLKEKLAPAILNALGLMKIVTYEPKPPPSLQK